MTRRHPTTRISLEYLPLGIVNEKHWELKNLKPAVYINQRGFNLRLPYAFYCSSMTVKILN